MNFKKILIHESNGLVKFQINRANALNAIDLEVMDELEFLLEKLEKKPPKVLLFSGDDTGYVASGGDLVQFAKLKSAEDGKKMAQKMADILTRIEALSCVTVAYINGNTYGGGCEMSLAFDMIYVNDQALFGFTQAYFALPPGWNGATRLIERIGKPQAINLLLSQKKISSEEALRIGLAQEVFHTEEQFLQRINLLLSYPEPVLRGIKHAVRFSSDEHVTRNERMMQEISHFSTMWAADEHHQAVETFLNRKK